jgi:hypothetical protein
MADSTLVEVDPASLGITELYASGFFDRPAVDEEIRAGVCELLLASREPARLVERRSSRRYPYPFLVRLSPVGSDGRTPCAPSIVVSGRSLSEGGFGFYHPQPISLRRVIAQFHVGNGRWVGFLMDLPWCRFTAEGWYESGGRFLSAVPVGEPPPIAGATHETPDKEKTS